MRILYADTGLRRLEGHHASSGIALPAAFRRLGHTVTALGHRDLLPELARAAGAQPFFQAFSYSGRSSDPIAGWLTNFRDSLDATLDDLRRAWRELGPFDLVYTSCTLPAQLGAIALWLKEDFPDPSAAGVPVVAVELGPMPGLRRSGPVGAATFTVREPSATLYRHVVDWLGKETLTRMSLLSVTPAVAEEYSFILDLPVTALPTPQALPAPRRRRRGSILTIGLLGHQRPDKGWQFAPDLVTQVLDRHPDVRFLAHQSDPNEMPDKNAEMRALADRQPRLEFLLEAKVNEAWFALIDRCDVIALPYEPVRYEGSYSAIFGEALSAGALLVVPAPTTLSAALAEMRGPGTSFTDWTAAGVVTAIGAAIADFDDLARRAYQAGRIWRRRHGPDPFVMAVLDAAGFGEPNGVRRWVRAQAKRGLDELIVRLP